MGVVPGLQSPLFPLFADKLLPSARPSNRFLLSCKPAGKEDPEEELQLCPWCNLPIGYWGYGADDDRYDKNALLHGECKAQLILQKLQDEDAAKRCEESKSREQSRKDFGIGWEVAQIPRNNALAGYLQCSVAPQGTCCVAVEEESHKLQLLPATDPATSINLEYLAVALQVRKQEGREPLFSLDPEDECRGAAFIKDMMQDKRYEPAWLAGTSAGEVMFQADYHLKELSMGAFDQPIVGLKSCFDYSELEGDDSPWRAREWFVVKKAEILLTQDGVLIPAVEMGVEAREQCLGPHGREDARITRPDHPLVKYAERFSHFFDLIAERKSVIFHLRELAKASTLAKFLIEDGFELPDEWFTLASETEPADDNMKIPQLWNELCVSKIQLRNGLIVDAEKGLFSSTHGVYGGVQFGLDRLPQVSPTRISAFARRGIRAAATITASSSHVPFGWGASPGVAQPRGVDLNLDRFDLSETKPADEAPANGWAHDQLELALGGTSFLEGLQKVDDSPFKQEDRDLLQAIFNPLLSDRQSEGSLFIPPDARQEYADRLKGLLAEEEEVRQQRMQHFLSKGFSMDDAGPLFPSSWTASLAIARERAPWSGCSKHDEGRQPTASEEALIAKQLKASAPLFDRSAEDGLRFRIYQVGSLEVRTTQPQGGCEVVGVVFKRLAVNTDTPKDRRILDTDKVVKITEYVEANKERKFAYFVVLEAENGAVMVTEKLHNGAVVWLEHPTDLESRTSFAKVTGCTACGERDVTVGVVKGFKNDEVQRGGYSASRKECQKYAQAIYAQAVPVWERRWEQLSTSQRGLVRDLGICSPSIWNEGNSRVFSLAWGALRETQKEAAQALGIRESDWGEWFRKSQEAPKEEGPATEKGAEAEEEEEDSGAACPRTCPKGHSLKRFKVDPLETEEDGGFECDGCDMCCFGGSVMWGCQKCDYDLCVKCAFVDPSIELTGGGGGKSEDDGEDEDEEGEEDEDEESEDEIMEATAVFGSAKASDEPEGAADEVAEDSSAEPAESLEEAEDDEGEEVARA